MFPMQGRDFGCEHIGRYFLDPCLASGGAASVYPAEDTTRQDGVSFAIKCIPKSPIHERRLQQAAEVTNHNTVIRCPNVLMLRDFFEDGDYLFLVLPLRDMDMHRAIWRQKVYWKNDSLIKKTFVDILDGVLACHKKGVFHRDLKPENIMCDSDGTRIAISDFGLSTNRRLCRDGGCGTTPYMSPECWSEIFYYAEPVDIWALGVILFNMVTCRYPWEEARPRDKAYMAFLTKKHLVNTFPISVSLTTLLGQIWDPIPLRRMSIPAIRQAVLEIDTFYKPDHSTHTTSPLSKEMVVTDSQQTYVNPVLEGEKGPRGLMDVLEKFPLCCLD